MQTLCSCLCALAVTMTLVTRARGDSGHDNLINGFGHTFLCTPAEQLSRPDLCSDYGPGHYAHKRRYLEFPLMLPKPPILTPEKREDDLGENYARAAPDTLVYGDPDSDGQPLRMLGIGQGVGYIFVRIQEIVESRGEVWALIKGHEYVRNRDLSQVESSGFQGVLITSSLKRPLAWIVKSYHPRKRPGFTAEPSARLLTRYHLSQVYATRRSDERAWYLVGPDEWVEQGHVGIIALNQAPDGVHGRWIDINLYEQTLIAYEDDRPVYATLVSSGINEWTTRPGLFQIYRKLDRDDMGGAFAVDQSDYYSIQDVPWVMYFDGDIGLHGTYWHDGFGFQRSHGCVNLAPRDARWLYDWADKGTWVWVRDPSGLTPGSVINEEDIPDF